MAHLLDGDTDLLRMHERQGPPIATPLVFSDTLLDAKDTMDHVLAQFGANRDEQLGGAPSVSADVHYCPSYGAQTDPNPGRRMELKLSETERLTIQINMGRCVVAGYVVYEVDIPHGAKQILKVTDRLQPVQTSLGTNTVRLSRPGTREYPIFSTELGVRARISAKLSQARESDYSTQQLRWAS